MNDNLIELNDFYLDQGDVILAFNRAAARYDATAVLQQEVGKRMLERFDLLQIQPKHIIDLGCGTGISTRALAKRFSKADVLGVDLADNMLRLARRNAPWLSKQRYLVADAIALPLSSHSVDLIFSNLMLPWVSDLEKLVTEVRRVLKPGGLFLFSSYGPDTLLELRKSFMAVDNQVHVHHFLDMHDVGNALLKTKFSDPVLDTEYFTLTYLDIYQLMRELKTLGQYNIAQGRRQSLTGKNRLKQVEQAYENYRDKLGVLPVTYEVIYGHAWAPELSKTSVMDEKGEVRISIQQIFRKSRK